ncbi:N-lysine methyltransferase KMT5A-like [Limanda limanda]|uniref:N-lysine methyltransferase KMT5A-like n=1 Tax=Limanda limanda TaxID=27771 RepID=UPI0029C7400D|nr:N-lysine methyltransferase KMT5A-like [Limanda limanda]
MFDLYWKEKTWCIDASREDGTLGRIVNDDHKQPNCKMKKVLSEGKPHLFLFALKDISVGEEITYDYGGTDWPWRKEVAGHSTVAVTDTFEAEIAMTPEKDPQRPPFFKSQK